MNLSIETLSKTYSNGVKALDGVNLEIKPGMFGLLGPNGAGKSSLMRTIATLQKPDSGRITFGDIDVLKNQLDLRKVLGYLPQEFGVYPNLSASDLLQYFAKLKGIKSKADRDAIINRVLEVTNLWDVRNKSVSGYSGGMKQRFGIAQLLLNDPKLIIVDEPTAGLDPAERHRFLNVLREIGTDHTVIFSTHIVDDVRELCHELAILNGGKILLRGTPKESIDQLDGKIWVRIISRDQLDEYTQKYNVISTNYNQDNTLNIRVYSDVRPDESFVNAQGQLEDVYFVALKNDQRHV
ncbi:MULTISPECIES: ABC transporter ATP-binding protein [Sphingobacterium]|jgi:ABC-type multidrug transport system ATPase subunit|uniref:ABC transporter ATP-binding protein n=1 Tax=Sphingobacterium TaxID=28453 RepID=UPI000958398D|nr:MULTISPECIES: ABC transporter ATP-binding protein [Sphingobacterium]APU98841.1 multidrug ABC transporter ATP-binding protein [Sphingobacterium sp. B29]MDR3007850.1 ABC transporter ATP-binding protein [Sphingobacterium sp.]UQA74473.1 ABC transporter ATP-binding protein [Sphingobacterium siyangense]